MYRIITVNSSFLQEVNNKRFKPETFGDIVTPVYIKFVEFPVKVNTVMESETVMRCDLVPVKLRSSHYPGCF